jgi:hypothetical protein
MRFVFASSHHQYSSYKFLYTPSIFRHLYPELLTLLFYGYSSIPLTEYLSDSCMPS